MWNFKNIGYNVEIKEIQGYNVEEPKKIIACRFYGVKHPKEVLHVAPFLLRILHLPYVLHVELTLGSFISNQKPDIFLQMEESNTRTLGYSIRV